MQQLAVVTIALAVLLIALAALVLRIVEVFRELAQTAAAASRGFERIAAGASMPRPRFPPIITKPAESPRERLWRETYGSMIHALVRNGGDETALRAPRLGQLAKTIADISVRQYDDRHKLAEVAEAPPPAMLSVVTAGVPGTTEPQS